VTGTLPVANGGTGITSLGAGVATWLGTPSSANLAAAVTDETGSGSLVFATSPTMITPTIGFSGNFTDSYLTNTTSSFAVGAQCYHQFKDANGVTGAINSWGSAYGGVYSLGIAISSNMVNNSSLGGTLQYGQTGVSTMYKQYAGGHYFYRAASGTGGSNISYQEVLSTDTSNNITFTAGNLIQGTAAKGINFTANTPAASMTSQLLNWYEEGTWTPDQGSGLTVVGAFSSVGRYTKIGNVVTVWGDVTGGTSIAVAAIGFITTNDITGGNSGSPVMDGKGNLIGLAFDGNYEALSHKIAFDKDLNRTICVDVRYVLWCVDKLGGAKNIIDELVLIK
jgi:hypothetical protein